jgi:thiol-disulfide isomerase/thioredoxin
MTMRGSKRTAALWLAGCLGMVCGSAVLAGPPNDDFASRTRLTGALVVATGTNVGATRESGEPDLLNGWGGRSVWWSWTAPQSGWATISTAGSLDTDGLALDTVVGIYTGSRVDALRYQASGDDSADATSRVRVRVTAGTEYQILVETFADPDGEYAVEGSIRLRINLSGPWIAPAWQLPDCYLNEIHSSDFAGNVVLLNFWATWCGPCVKEIPDLIEVYNDYAPLGLTVVGISLDSYQGNEPPTGLLQEFMATEGITYPVVIRTPQSVVTDNYGGITGIPTTFVIDRNNEIVDMMVGSRDRATFERAILP